MHTCCSRKENNKTKSLATFFTFSSSLSFAHMDRFYCASEQVPVCMNKTEEESKKGKERNKKGKLVKDISAVFSKSRINNNKKHAFGEC